MKIQLKKAWLVKDHEIIEGWGFEIDKLHNGITERENEKFFTKDGETYQKNDWCAKIFFDLQYANIELRNKKESDIEYAKKQIEYYTNRLKEAGGEL